MVFLKEDGSLDVERINKLPIEEWMEMVGDMTKEEIAFLESHTPLNEGTAHTKAVTVDYTMEEEIERGSAVDAEELINNLREELKRNNEDNLF